MSPAEPTAEDEEQQPISGIPGSQRQETAEKEPHACLSCGARILHPIAYYCTSCGHPLEETG